MFIKKYMKYTLLLHFIMLLVSVFIFFTVFGENMDTSYVTNILIYIYILTSFE